MYSVLLQAAANFITVENEIPPNCHTYWAEGPHPVTVLTNSQGGGAWYGFGVTGTIDGDHASSCAVPSSGRWDVATCGCDDSRNGNLVGVGVDGFCYCKAPYTWSEKDNACIIEVDIDRTKKVLGCGLGNPIYPATGTKVEVLSTDASVGGSKLTLSYTNNRRLPLVDHDEIGPPAFEQSNFGSLWFSNFHKRLEIGPSARGIRADRGDGRVTSFQSQGNGYFTSDADVNDRLIGATGSYRYIDSVKQAQEEYDSAGVLRAISFASGQRLIFTYSDADTSPDVAPGSGYLLTVQDVSGRALEFRYQVGGLVSRVEATGISSLTPSYDVNGNLVDTKWADNTVGHFLYENPIFPWALTGVRDEQGARRSTFGYDSEGRAISTERAGAVNQYMVSYTSAPQIVVNEEWDQSTNITYRTFNWQPFQSLAVTYPTGATVGWNLTSVLGQPLVANRSQPGGAGCSASTSATTYDGNGNPASRDDFSSNRVCYANDLSRNLEAVRVEGLSSSVACAGVFTNGAAIPAGSRKVTTQWHPEWRLETKVAEPRRVLTSVYNGQPDPFSGNATAACAPSTATLPDGKPMVVLCRQIEQATTDVDGSHGFGAALQSGVSARETRWTYNQYGQAITETDPLGRTSTFTYYTDTAFTGDDPNAVGHTQGDLQQTVNAAGHVTTYTHYNKAGRLLHSVDPNGVMTVSTYDLRGRLTSTTLGDQTTVYEWWPTGLLKRLTEPDGSWLHHDYDAAHRLLSVTDNLGNKINYTLDNLGNRLSEQVSDPSGVLRHSLSRSIDPLGRVQQITGRP